MCFVSANISGQERTAKTRRAEKSDMMADSDTRRGCQNHLGPTNRRLHNHHIFDTPFTG